MNHLGLFEGIGGFSLAARWARWKTKGWVEINPFCQKVLKHHFPEAQGFSDIKKFSYAVYKSILRNRGIKDRRVNIITGGFPCQPYSSAGKRKGTDDSRHLWPEMLRAIQEIKPAWVVGENVRGLTNWNGGLVFEQVQIDLEAIGYEVQAFILPACAVGAPHRRDRVWFVARKVCGLLPNPISNGFKWDKEFKKRRIVEQDRISLNEFNAFCSEGFITYTKYEGLERRNRSQKSVRLESGSEKVTTNSDRRIRCQGGVYQVRRIQTERHVSLCGAWDVGNWYDFPTQSPLCGRNDGISTGLVGITFPRHRRESVQAYGNAIVPQVAWQIFKAINEFERGGQPVE